MFGIRVFYLKMENSKEQKEISVAGKWLVNEDWASVLAGAGVIVLVLTLSTFESPGYNWDSGAELFGIISGRENLSRLFFQMLLVFAFSACAAILIGKNLLHFAGAFFTVFFLTQIALFAAGSGLARQFNLEAVIFSLGLGLLIGNLIQVPEWVKKNLTTELLVKIGLVLLGASVIFSDILKAGGLGLIQALMVVVSVWYFAFWVFWVPRFFFPFSLILKHTRR